MEDPSLQADSKEHEEEDPTVISRLNYYLTLRTLDFELDWESAARDEVINIIATVKKKNLEAVLGVIRMLDDEDVVKFAGQAIAPEQFPSSDFLKALSEPDRIICIRACLLVYTATRGSVVPRQFQLEASLESIRGRDSVVIAGTGHGKTLCIAIPLLLFPDTTTITISPLKRLQMMQVKDFVKYGINTVAINEDTPHTEALWKDISDGAISHLIVQPEQFKMYHGHLPRLGQLLHNKKFVDRIKRVHVDEAHNIYTSGTKKNGFPAFRPAWGSLDEVRVRLSKKASWQALSATLPPHILKVVDEKLCLSPKRRLIQMSINRQNITYATHPVVGGLSNFRNLDCLIPKAFHPPMRLPKLLILHDDKNEATNLSSYLNARLPEAFRELGVCKHYHGDMSPEYLEKTFTSFAHPDGFTIILNGTSGAGTGIDVRGIDGVIQYGICTEVPEMFQRGGRGGRDRDGFAFFLMMTETWVSEIDVNILDSEEAGINNPDRPFCPKSARKVPTKQDRCGIASLRLVKLPHCIRKQFADYFDDHSAEALHYTGHWCCNCHIDSDFSLSSFFLGPIYTGEDDSNATKRKRTKYRPVPQREALEKLLRTWVVNAHKTSPFRFGRRSSSIIDDTAIKSLTMALPETIKSTANITQLLEQSEEWEAAWAADILSLMTAYDSSLTSKEDMSSDEEQPLIKRVR